MSIYVDLWHADLGQEDSICFIYFNAEITLLSNMPNLGVSVCFKLNGGGMLGLEPRPQCLLGQVL